MSELGKSLLAVAFVLCCVFGCNWYNSYKKDKQREEYLAKKRQDSLRVAFIKDSLAHDPRYQDSVRMAKIAHDKWKIINDSISREEIVGFILVGDSCYHTVVHEIKEYKDGMYHSYSMYDIPNLRFVTLDDVNSNHYKQCATCEEIESAYEKYENGDVIDIDEIGDYVYDNYEDFEEIFEIARPEPDYDDRW